jgi:hypothetical protein
LLPSASSSTEAGLDVKFLENRLGLSVTYFDAIQGPGIVTQGWSEASGYSGGRINGVKTEKKGWEVSLDGTPVRTAGGLTWNVLINWSTYVERYKEFYAGLQSLNGQYLNSDSRHDYKIGERADNFYGYKFFRDPSGQIIHESSGLILRDNRIAVLLGHYNPDYVWSFVNTITYKSFALNFQFDGRVGGVGDDYVYYKQLQGGRGIETVQGAYGAARLAEFQANPNNDPNVYTPVYTGKGVVIASGAPVVDPNTGQLNNSELTFAPNTNIQYLQDYVNREVGFDERIMISKSFAKLRQLMLTYNLPSATLQKVGIRQGSVSFVGRNLLYFAKRTDIDLDQFIGTNTGAQILQSPTLRRYGININLTF